jgi:single-stranded-DNA-specific exonuclease
METARALRAAGPWGQGFPEPIFDGEFTVADARVVGGRHMKLMLDLRQAPHASVEAIAFGSGSDANLTRGAPIRLAYRLEVNEFRGTERVQLNCQHIGVGRPMC